MGTKKGAAILLLGLAGCNRGGASVTAEGGGAAATGAGAASAAASAAPSASINGLKTPRPAERVPSEYGRYYIDSQRFSAVFPQSPYTRYLPPVWTAVEARTDQGDFEVLCTPQRGDGDEFARARTKAVEDGKMLSDSHPDFHGTESYEIHVLRKDGGLRYMKFVKYARRFCSVSFEMDDPKNEPVGTRFIESFRPEREQPPPSP